ncbi:FHA domain-containing protein, partial [Streptomyces sp. NPDC023723]|uniref:FHA domain-containing protein n=1 Tax=Streptomyces sp. NPDC023723 TaxID=3154323 RepID=UPI0033D1F544
MPELVLEANGQTWTLDPSRSYALGRDPQGDIVFDDARVSWRHATVRFDGRGWVIEDNGSTNGTFVQGRRIHQSDLGPGTAVHLGNATDGPRLTLSGTAAAVTTPQAQPGRHHDLTPHHDPAPHHQQPAPHHQQPAPHHQQPAPHHQQPAPHHQQPAPHHQQPAP